jgi:hypothetical protein
LLAQQAQCGRATNPSGAAARERRRTDRPGGDGW